MKRKRKAYLKLNIMSLIFLVVSFISFTYAWFAYSGLVDANTEIDVKAWNIKIEKDGKQVSNEIVISLEDIYPGMEPVTEDVNIKNFGDSDASIRYEIKSARLLGNVEDEFNVDGTNVTSQYVEDLLSHEYPFHVNINLSKGYALSNGGESKFTVSISWPLDSGDDEKDSDWGKAAYDFESYQSSMLASDNSYQIKPSIQIVISLTAEQYIVADTSSDPNYDLGDEILFNVVNNARCSEVSENCLKTHVIDKNNTYGDDIVTLLPDVTSSSLPTGVYSSYGSNFINYTSAWTVNKRPLVVGDLLNIVSSDVVGSFLSRENISDLVIGDLSYQGRMAKEVNRAISYNGYFKFLNQNYSYFTSTSCYWIDTEYNTSNSFAVKANSEIESRVYKELKETTCKVVPVIIANKTNL